MDTPTQPPVRPVKVTATIPQAADGCTLYHLSNGWIAYREQRVHRRHYREHPYTAYVPGAGPHGTALPVVTARALRDLLANATRAQGGSGQ